MKLYFNGCSFTYGDDLQNPTKDAWPTLVANHFNSEFKNDAISGGTNDRIIFNTISNINNYDMFFIAWTSYSRFTQYYYANNTEVNFNPSANFNFESLYDNQELKHNKEHYTKYSQLHYKFWYNNLRAFNRYLQQIICLQSILTTHDKKFLMVNTFSNDLDKWLTPKDRFISAVTPLIDRVDLLSDDLILKEYDNIQRLNNLIDHSKFVEWNNWYIISLIKTHNVPTGPTNHMLHEGHYLAAQKIISEYDKI